MQRGCESGVGCEEHNARHISTVYESKGVMYASVCNMNEIVSMGLQFSSQATVEIGNVVFIYFITFSSIGSPELLRKKCSEIQAISEIVQTSITFAFDTKGETCICRIEDTAECPWDSNSRVRLYR